MNSSREKKPETLARRSASAAQSAPNLLSERSDKDLLRALMELANLRDEAAAFGRFDRKWAGFVRVDERVGPGWWASVLQAVGPTFLPAQFHHMYRRREAVRRIWRGDSEMVALLLLPEVPPEELTPNEREKYIEKVDAKGLPIDLARPPQIRFDWQLGQVLYEARTEFQRALYALFRKSALAKVCANSECPAPYFIARKPAQRYCSDGCAEVFQRAWKRKWWAEHGEEWRRSRKKARSRRRSKQ